MTGFLHVVSVVSAATVLTQDHYAASKAEAGPKTPHKDVMKLLAVKWSAQKAR